MFGGDNSDSTPQGVPEEAIVEEPLAMTTVDNVLYVYEVCLLLLLLWSC